MAKYKIDLVKKPSLRGQISKFNKCFDIMTTQLTRTGRYHTGLEEADVKRLAKAIGIEEDRLRPPVNMYDNTSIRGSFWKTFGLRVDNKGKVLDTDDPWDEISYLFCKGRSDVAQGMNAIEAHHDFVLTNVDEESERKNAKAKILRRALLALDKMKPEEMRKCLIVMGRSTQGYSDALVESTLNEMVNREPQRFLLLWVENADREQIEFIEKCLEYNIMRKSKTTYYYGSDIIGHTRQEAVAWVKDPKNRDVMGGLQGELKTKIKI